MKKVFLDDLPRKVYCGKECIDWVKSIGHKIKFIPLKRTLVTLVVR